MEKHKAYQWWITFTLICLGTVALFVTGMFSRVNAADVTKISYLISLLFAYYTVRLGMINFSLPKLDTKRVKKFLNGAWFVSDKLLTLGMIGTVIGFIYMLSSSFGNIAVANTASLRAALSTMAVGMSTAFYTTAAGLICSLLLKIQLYPMSSYVEDDDGTI